MLYFFAIFLANNDLIYLVYHKMLEIKNILSINANNSMKKKMLLSFKFFNEKFFMFLNLFLKKNFQKRHLAY